MLPELTPELKEAQALGITLFAGEAEGQCQRRFNSDPSCAESAEVKLTHLAGVGVEGEEGSPPRRFLREP